MQLKNKLRSLFTRKDLNSSTAELTSPLKEAITSGSLYRSISDLPLSIFIKCIVDDDLHSLIISGTVQPSELIEAWSEIRQQYADAIGDHEHRFATSLYKEVSLLKNKYQSIILLIDMLSHAYKKELADELNDLLGTNFSFNTDDTEKYAHELQRCLTRSNSFLLDLELKERQYESISGNSSKSSKPPKKEYFYSILITLSDHAKYAVQDTITVFEFCERLKRYNHYVEEVKRLNSK